ncbi:hypothetical protein Agub_g11532, partial [Astrephomene gubernaculifera]
DLSDETGAGEIEGVIPSTWLTMTKLKTIDLSGHSKFCKDWHRIVSYKIMANYNIRGGHAGWTFPYKDGHGPSRQGVTITELNAFGWQWYDDRNGEAGYTRVIA